MPTKAREKAGLERPPPLEELVAEMVEAIGRKHAKDGHASAVKFTRWWMAMENRTGLVAVIGEGVPRDPTIEP